MPKIRLPEKERQQVGYVDREGNVIFDDMIKDDVYPEVPKFTTISKIRKNVIKKVTKEEIEEIKELFKKTISSVELWIK